MKKFNVALALFCAFLASVANAQAVDSSQVKMKTNGGLAGDTSNALAVAVYRAASAPSSPVTGQLWCDTTLSPCTLKQYTGSVWTAPQVNAAITTQADVTSFPGSPVDGQIFYAKTPPSLWVYDGTAAVWVTISLPFSPSAANIRDTYTGTLVAGVGAATAATSATAGSLSAGTYSYKIACRTATGGETDAGSTTASNTITSLVSKSADLSSIPVCSGGTTTNRNVYRTLVNQAGTGPWYLVGNIADNSTTTYHDGLADTSNTRMADINYSAPLPGTWTVGPTTSFPTSGGCGGTGGTRGSMACQGGATGTGGYYTYNVSATSDTGIRAMLDISSYVAGNYTIQYRVKQLSQLGDILLNSKDSVYGGVRVGTADNAVRGGVAVGGAYGGGSLMTLPFSSSNHGSFVWGGRATVGVAATNSNSSQNPWPQIDAVPFWVRLRKRGIYLRWEVSADGVNWSPTANSAGPTGCVTAANNTTATCASDATTMNGANSTRFEIPVGTGISPVTMGWIEIDNFTLTVN